MRLLRQALSDRPRPRPRRSLSTTSVPCATAKTKGSLHIDDRPEPAARQARAVVPPAQPQTIFAVTLGHWSRSGCDGTGTVFSAPSLGQSRDSRPHNSPRPRSAFHDQPSHKAGDDRTVIAKAHSLREKPRLRAHKQDQSRQTDRNLPDKATANRAQMPINQFTNL
jgi:hypothetical protein